MAGAAPRRCPWYFSASSGRHQRIRAKADIALHRIAHQRLDTEQAAVLRRHLRLEVQHELALVDRRAQTGGYKVAGKWLHSDQFSRSQQLGLVLLGASIPAGLQWKTMDGSFVTLTQALAGQILAAGAASDAAIFAHAEQLIAQARAAPDPSTIDPLAGWPKIYGE